VSPVSSLPCADKRRRDLAPSMLFKIVAATPLCLNTAVLGFFSYAKSYVE
jgi:hypothetical protein